MYNRTLIRLFISVTKFIRIGIADKNDNPPYFDKALYEAEVDENEDIQHTVLTVTAKDHDECEYLLIVPVSHLFPIVGVQNDPRVQANPHHVVGS